MSLLQNMVKTIRFFRIVKISYNKKDLCLLKKNMGKDLFCVKLSARLHDLFFVA